jgi:hypothetical protein
MPKEKRILVVDGEPRICEFLEILLARCGCRLEELRKVVSPAPARSGRPITQELFQELLRACPRPCVGRAILPDRAGKIARAT